MMGVQLALPSKVISQLLQLGQWVVEQGSVMHCPVSWTQRCPTCGHPPPQRLAVHIPVMGLQTDSAPQLASKQAGRGRQIPAMQTSPAKQVTDEQWGMQLPPEQY